jgi:hypothetical protein
MKKSKKMIPDYDSEQEKILREVKDLLNIPAFKKVLVHKIEELKVLLGEDIAHYKGIRERLQLSAASGAPEGIEFQLNRLGTSLWVPSLRSPTAVENDIYDIIPDEVIRFIVKHDIQPDLIVTKMGISFPELPGRVFNLYFERVGENLVTGVISEKQAAQGKARSLPATLENWVDMKMLSLFFDYMLSDHTFHDHMVHQFKLVWKPLIDKQRLKSS